MRASTAIMGIYTVYGVYQLILRGHGALNVCLQGTARTNLKLSDKIKINVQTHYKSNDTI